MIVETIVSWIYSSANYYRAEIVEFLPKGKVKVMLLDVGEYREIPCNELMCMPPINTVRKFSHSKRIPTQKLWEAYNTPHDHPALVYRIELDIENRDEEKCLQWLQAHNNEMVYVMFTSIGHDPAQGDVQSICGKIFDRNKTGIPISEDEALGLGIIKCIKMLLSVPQSILYYKIYGRSLLVYTKTCLPFSR